MAKSEYIFAARKSGFDVTVDRQWAGSIGRDR
jgi:hypothetical protein